VGSRAVLDTMSKRKIPSTRRESKPDHPIVQPVASRYTDRAITALDIRSFVRSFVRSFIHSLQIQNYSL